MKSLKHNLLPVAVFITGASVLVIEVLAMRVLSPYYGNTIFTTSSVISVILLALSFGYYAGGKFADRHPSLQWFFRIILVSGLTVLFFHFIGKLILPLLSMQFSIFFGPLVAALVLFLLPAILLGMLSPYAVKLQSVHFPKQGVGTVSGKIFFWSTLGSILGSLLAGFVLIPHFGIDQIFIANGILLFLLGLFPLFILGSEKKQLLKSLLVFVTLLGMVGVTVQETRGNVIYSKDGVYEKLIIYEGIYSHRPTRFFQQDRTSSSGMFLDSEDPLDLAYNYTKYYVLYKILNPRLENVLVIGGGAYSIPKAVLAESPGVIVDVAEIEPSLFDLAKKYFRLTDNPRLHNYVEDGRRFLHDSEKKYDLIFSDVYASLFSVPAHFTTQEFFTIAKEKMNEDGIFIANVIGDLSQEQPTLIMAEIRTFLTVFPNSYFFAVSSPDSKEPQNILFVGYNSDKKLDVNHPLLTENPDIILRSLKDKIIDVGTFDFSRSPVLTDNFAPVEYLSGQVLQRSSVR